MSNTLESAPGSKESIPSELTGSSSSLKLSDSLVSITGLEEVSLQSTKAIDTDCPDGGTHAWLEAFGATGIFFCTVGYINSFGMFQQYYQGYLLAHETPSAISWIGSVQVFAQYAAALVGGPLFDQYGAMTLWPPAFLWIISLMVTSVCQSYIQLFLIQGVLGGFACGMLMCAALTATSQYFSKYRATVMAVNVSASSIGGIFTPLVLGRMIYHAKMGFLRSMQIYGVINMTILLLSCTAIQARLPPRRQKIILLSAFRHLSYDAIVFANFLLLLGLFVPLFYTPIHARQHGVPEHLATYFISIINSASFFGRLLPALLVRRMGHLNLLFLCSVSASLVLCFWHYATTQASIIAFISLYGFFSGTIISLLPSCFGSEATNPRDIGAYMGMGLFLSAMGALIGPPIMGELVKRYAGFQEVMWTCAASLSLGAMIVLLSKWLGGKSILSWK